MFHMSSMCYVILEVYPNELTPPANNEMATRYVHIPSQPFMLAECASMSVHAVARHHRRRRLGTRAPYGFRRQVPVHLRRPQTMHLKTEWHQGRTSDTKCLTSRSKTDRTAARRVGPAGDLLVTRDGHDLAALPRASALMGRASPHSQAPTCLPRTPKESTAEEGQPRL